MMSNKNDDRNDDNAGSEDQLPVAYEDTTAILRTSGLFRVTRGSSEGQPFLVAIGGSAVGKMYPIDVARVTTIGRSSEADVIVNDTGVSRIHAKIYMDGEKLVVVDNESTNGVTVNGIKTRKHVLDDGDRLRIGTATVLKFSFHDVIEENFQRQMYDSVVRDGLTGVHNKRFFQDNLLSDFAYHQRHNTPLSIVMLDVDHFKRVNDTFGHPVGDVVLQDVAKLIQKGLRVEDIVCRYGGEEFAVILRDTDTEEAVVVAERIRQDIARFEFKDGDVQLRATASMGVATLKGKNFKSPEELVEKADKYLYAAKHAGRNRVAYKKPEA